LAERLPETCRVAIAIKFELSAFVGFIHKESITMHGHTVLKEKAAIYIFHASYVDCLLARSGWNLNTLADRNN
jgi:hypothetical protein